AGPLRVLLDEIARHHAGVITRAAGDDVHLFDVPEDIGGGHAKGLLQHVAIGEALFQRLGDRTRLLEDFLEHVMAVFAALDSIRGELAFTHRALDVPAVRIHDAHALAAD